MILRQTYHSGATTNYDSSSGSLIAGSENKEVGFSLLEIYAITTLLD
jgi:hypothetical protein